MYSRVGFSALAAVAGFLAFSSSTSAQTTNVDRGWLPWQGCWRAEGASEAEKLCIVPDGAGVRLITLEGAAVRVESRVVTDGRARAVNQEGCTGTELANWSADGQRVFLTSDLSCEGGARRRVTGIFAMSGAAEWVSAQAVTIGDQTAARSVRYFAIPPGNLPAAIANALPNARSIAGAREGLSVVVDADDITEAVNRVDAAAVEEWLTITGQPFQLADDLQPTQVTGGSVSALDMVSRGSYYNQDSYSTNEVVHVVERPTVIHHTTYVNTVYRSCWDPWFAGYVTITRGVYLGIGSNHYGSCGRHYYSRYSPWGYDLWGWRHVRQPIIIVRNNTPIIHRPPPPVDWNRDRGSITRNYDPRGTVTGVAVPRDGSTTGTGTRGQVTRSGYSNGATTRTTTAPPTQPSNSGSGSRYAQPATPRSSGGTTRTQVSSAGYTRTPRPTPPSTSSTSQSEAGYRTSQPSATSRGTAVPRSTSGSSSGSSSSGSRPSPSFRSSGSSSSSQSSPTVIRGTSTSRPESQPTPVRAKPRGN